MAPGTDMNGVTEKGERERETKKQRKKDGEQEANRP